MLLPIHLVRLAYKLANMRRKNRKKSGNRYKNKQMRKQYEAGLASVMSVVRPMDALYIRDIPVLQANLENDEEVSGNRPVLHDSAGDESISGNNGPLPPLHAAGIDLVQSQ